MEIQEGKKKVRKYLFYSRESSSLRYFGAWYSNKKEIIKNGEGKSSRIRYSAKKKYTLIGFPVSYEIGDILPLIVQAEVP